MAPDGKVPDGASRKDGRMSKPIAPTPHLNAEESERFLALVDKGLKHPCGPVAISVSNDLIHRQHQIKVENAGEILWKELCNA